MSLENVRSLGDEISNHLRMASAHEPDSLSRSIIESFATEIEKALAKELKQQRWEPGSVRGLRFLPYVFNQAAVVCHVDL